MDHGEITYARRVWTPVPRDAGRRPREVRSRDSEIGRRGIRICDSTRKAFAMVSECRPASQEAEGSKVGPAYRPFSIQRHQRLKSPRLTAPVSHASSAGRYLGSL